MNSWPKPKKITPVLEDLIKSFQNNLETISTEQSPMTPCLAIIVVANLAYHRAKIPSAILEKIEGSAKDPDTRRIIEWIRQRVSGDEILIGPPEEIKIGSFKLQHNPFREGYFNINQTIPCKINTPIDPEKDFHLGKVDRREKFYIFSFEGQGFDLYHSKLPFAPYHFVLVPQTEKIHTQYIDPANDREILLAILRIVRSGVLGDSIRIGYNSYGAHATLNHLHFQGFLITDDWEPPLERVLENSPKGENIDHFLRGCKWLPNDEDGESQLLDLIKEANERADTEGVRYNLYITPQRIGYFPRRSQFDERYQKRLKELEISTGLAFLEMAYEIVCPKRVVFDLYKSRQDDRPIRELFEVVSLY